MRGWPSGSLALGVKLYAEPTFTDVAGFPLMVGGWSTGACETVIVKAGKDGAPITDGVFPESKEFLAGYLMVDVESAERAYEIAAIWSAAPGPQGLALNMPIEVRQVMSAGAGELP